MQACNVRCALWRSEESLKRRLTDVNLHVAALELEEERRGGGNGRTLAVVEGLGFRV